MLIVLPILVGLLVGVLISLTGMGGGAIITPFLILVMKVNPVLAIGTDLVFAAATKWVSGVQHKRQKNVRLRVVAWLALGSLPMSFLTSSFVLTRHARSNDPLESLLPKILGAVLIFVSLYTLARLFNWIKVNEDINWPPKWALVLIGAFGGGLVGLTSVGSGTVIMASLLIFFSLPPTQLVGLDVMHGALLATVPAGVYALGGQVAWPLVGLLLLGSIPGAWLGTRLIKRVPQRLVRGTLSAFLLFAGVRLFI